MLLLHKIVIILILLGLLFIAVIYIALRTRKKDVTGKAPFAGIKGKTMVLKRKMWLVRNHQNDVKINPYTLTEPGIPLNDEAKHIRTLAVGTNLQIEKVLLFKNGMSSVQTTLVTGTLLTPNENAIPFEYEWGDCHFLNDDQPYWTFPVAPWQTEKDTHKYSFPEFMF
ncbi:hypothetical protein GCM10028807_41010 [Spirosoma daeguense]